MWAQGNPFSATFGRSRQQTRLAASEAAISGAGGSRFPKRGPASPTKAVPSSTGPKASPLERAITPVTIAEAAAPAAMPQPRGKQLSAVHPRPPPTASADMRDTHLAAKNLQGAPNQPNGTQATVPQPDGCSGTGCSGNSGLLAQATLNTSPAEDTPAAATAAGSGEEREGPHKPFQAVRPKTARLQRFKTGAAAAVDTMPAAFSARVRTACTGTATLSRWVLCVAAVGLVLLGWLLGLARFAKRPAFGTSVTGTSIQGHNIQFCMFCCGRNPSLPYPAVRWRCAADHAV